MGIVKDRFPFINSLLILLVYCLFLTSPSQGIYLEQLKVNTLKNKRIAYYPGSFDPLHLGHMTVVETVLDKKLADFVLVYALPDSDTYKNRTSQKLRLSMLDSVYRNHPRVLITTLTPLEMQTKLMPLFKSVEFAVVQGSDVINEYVHNTQYDELWMRGMSIQQYKPEHANTSLGAIMAIPAKRVIACNRVGDDISFVGKTYKNLPLTILVPTRYAELSSTKARIAAQKQESLESIVPAAVIEIIYQNQLYRN